MNRFPPLALLAATFLLGFAAGANERANNGPVPDWPLTVSNVVPAKAGLGNRIAVVVEGASNALQRATADTKKIVLVLNNIVLRGLCTDAVVLMNTAVITNAVVDPNTSVVTQTTNSMVRLQFELRRDEPNKAGWVTLLGSPRSKTRRVDLEIGNESNNSVAIIGKASNQLELVLLPDEPFLTKGGRKWNLAAFAAAGSVLALFISGVRTRSLGVLLEGWIWVCWAILLTSTYLCFGPTWCWVVFAILFLIGFFYLAKKTEMLRDSGPQPPAHKLRPYSLARTQMAVWFFLGISAFIFIWLMTNSLDTITGTVLALMGIGAGTALGAEAQETGKLNKLKAEKQELEAKKPRSDDDERRLKKLQRLLLDVPCLEAERKKLKRLEEIVAKLAIADLLSRKRVDLIPRAEALIGSPKTPEQQAASEEISRINRELERMAPLQDEQRRLQTELALTSAPADRIREIDDLLSSRPISKGFFEDILTDDVGISFHRFQMFVWTLVLGIIFVASVYHQLAMPEFSDPLLALMGISSGTYMGFMIAEPKK